MTTSATRGTPRRRGGGLRRVAVAIGGGLLLVLGCVLIVLPGPGIVVIVAGLGLLATEFDWAKRWLAVAKDRAQRTAAAGASSPASLALTLLVAAGLVAVGVLCCLDVDTGISLVDRVTSPLVGVFLILSGLVTAGLTLAQRRGNAARA